MTHPGSLPTLVMGARGSVGRHVLAELVSRGRPVRASARKPVPGQFPAGVEVAAADLTDPASLAAAFDGVGQVFLYAQPEGVDRVVETARAAGVRTIVLLSSGSVLHPTSRGNAITEEHRAVEQVYDAAALLTVVPIRPLVLATNALGWAYPTKPGPELAIYQPDAVTAPIHEKDVAAVAVAALLGDRSPSVSGLLTGPTRLSQRDQVAAIAAATGTTIAVRGLTRDEATEKLRHFLPDEEAEAVLQFLDDAAAGNSPATSAVQDVLGRPATPFGTWAVDHRDDFR